MIKSFLFTLVSIFLVACYLVKNKVEYSDLIIEGKKANRYIVDRKPNYGNGNQDGCVIARQITLDIDELSNDTIIGLVIDSKDKEPLPFSNIKLIYFNEEKLDSTELMANINGRFRISIGSMPNSIHIRNVGYQTLRINLINYK